MIAIRSTLLDGLIEGSPVEQIYSTIVHRRVPTAGVLLIIGYDRGTVTFLCDEGLFCFHMCDIVSWHGFNGHRLYVQPLN